MSEQIRSDQRIANLANAIADDLDQFLHDRILILQTLAASPSGKQLEISALEAQAGAFLEDGTTDLLLRDEFGRLLLNAAGPYDTALTDKGLSAFPRPTMRPGPNVSDLVGGDGISPPVILVEVPIIRDGALRGSLAAVLRSPAFDVLFSRNNIAGDLMGLITDRTGRVIGRSTSSRVKVGSSIPDFSGRKGESGFWFGLSGVGVPIRAAYRRSPEYEFLVNVGITQAAFIAPLERTLWTLGGLALALLVGTCALSAPLLRRMLVAHSTLAETAELLGLAQEAAEAALWEWDIDSRYVTLSARSAYMHGLPVPEGASQIVISTEEWEACVFSEDLPRVWEKTRHAIETGKTYSTEFRTHDPKSARSFRCIQAFGRVICDKSGKPSRLIGLDFEVSALRETEEALRESTALLQVSEERLSLALDSGGDGLFDWDFASDAVWLSPRWLNKLGYAADAPTRTADFYFDVVHPNDREDLVAVMQAHLAGSTPALEAEYRRCCADGSYIWVLLRGRVVKRDAADHAVRIVGTLIDITRRKEAELAVAHMALHDSLTDLPNRNLFDRHLQKAIDEAAISSSMYAVLACDLDRFKAVNDTFGHPAGDRLLCLVADRIRAVVRSQDCVARLGGDEFALILSNVDYEETARQACERIIVALGEPILLDGHVINVGISIGVAFVSGESLSTEQVFRRADMALYQAKAAGRNTYRLYEAGSYAQAANRSLIALDMKEAIHRGDFSLVYQPIIDIIANRVSSFEALMRWSHPERGLISPGEFIPVAEETGLIVPLGAWALLEACREAMRWPDDVRIGVNVSAVQFNGGLEETVTKALATSGLPARRLKLEVTESLLMQHPEQAVTVLHNLRDMGVRIALDDFGTGYSSLSYLRRFPFDKLKIDRAFVKDIADPDAAAIVRAVVGIGERLGMGVVAEGVETLEQLDIVRREGCTEVQGFLFSRPLPPNEALAFLLERQAELV